MGLERQSWGRHKITKRQTENLPNYFSRSDAHRTNRPHSDCCGRKDRRLRWVFVCVTMVSHVTLDQTGQDELCSRRLPLHTEVSQGCCLRWALPEVTEDGPALRAFPEADRLP